MQSMESIQSIPTMQINPNKRSFIYLAKFSAFAFLIDVFFEKKPIFPVDCALTRDFRGAFLQEGETKKIPSYECLFSFVNFVVSCVFRFDGGSRCGCIGHVGDTDVTLTLTATPATTTTKIFTLRFKVCFLECFPVQGPGWGFELFRV